MKDRISQKNVFTGGMDMDSALTAVKENDYIRATNIRTSINEQQQFQIVTNVKGNTLVPYQLPTGYNKEIGSYEDKYLNTLFYFVYNSNGQHSILRYYPNSNTIEKVSQDSVYGWTVETKITHCNLVDKKLLYWIDPQPRKINVEKATDNKKRKYKVKVLDGVYEANSSPTPDVPVHIKLSNGTGYILYPTNIDEIVAAINNPLVFLSQYMTAEACGDVIEIEFKQVNTLTLEVQTTVPTNLPWAAVPGEKAIAIPDNFYSALTERIVYRGKYPHPCNPEIRLINDSDKGYNYLKDKHFQFLIGRFYDDNDRAVLSPLSDLSMFDCASLEYNGIRVTFTEQTFYTIATLATLQLVEIYAREGNLGKPQRIKTLQREEIWNESGEIVTQYFDFFNEGNYETVSDIVILRYWDAIGRTVQGQDYADDRLFDANMLENYDKPCPDIDVTAEFTPLTKLNLFNITGLIKIWTDDFYGSGSGAKDGFIYNYGNNEDGTVSSDVWGTANSGSIRSGEITRGLGQYFAPGHGGFEVYLVGTPYFAVSRQMDYHGLPITATGALSAGTQDEINDIIAYIQSPTPSNQKFQSQYTLRNIPSGCYVLRVASHWCSFGDGLGKGAFYDLNNNAFYKTSTSIKSFTDQTGNELGAWVYEIRIEIDDNGDYRLFSQNATTPHDSGTADATNSIYAGEIIVYDKISGLDSSELRWCVDGYLIDSGGGSDNGTMRDEGVFIERQKIELFEVENVRFGDGSNNTKTIITDHNGYFFTRVDGVNNAGKEGNQTYVTFKGYSINSHLLFDFDENFKISTGLINGSILKDLYDGSIINSDSRNIPFAIPTNSVSTVGDVIPDAGSFYWQILLYNNNSLVTQQNRTRISGRVVDTTGAGIQNLSVVYERNGRQEFTGADGTFTILVYGDWKSPETNARVIDNLIVYNPNDCEIKFTRFGNQGPFYRNTVNIVYFNNPYNDDVGIAPADFNDLVALFIKRGSRYLKGGGSYRLALLYVDDLFRRCDLVISDKIYLPFVTENRQKIEGISNTMTSGAANGFFTFTLNLLGTAPTWAKHVWILRTLDAGYNFLLQFPAWDVKYVADYDGTNIVETTFETSTATELYINITESLSKYQFRNAGSLKAYIFTEGDRIRFISDAKGVLITDLNGNPTLLDLKIKAERTIDTATYLVVDLADSLPKMESGMLVEIYTPKLEIEKEGFYEIHTCIEIINGVYQQTVIPLDTGDIYRRTRIVPVQSGASVNFIEDSSISDFYPSEDSDIGKVSFENPDFKEILRTNAIRFSGKFFEDTKVNNLSTWELLNVEQIPKVMGAINALKLTNDDSYRAVLLAICENNVASCYVGDAIISDVAGEDLISLSSKVLPAIRILKGDYGTTNPESVAVRDGNVWWYDNLRGKFIRYALNGLVPISDGNSTSNNIQSLATSLKSPRNVVPATYDVYHKEYVVTIHKKQLGTVVNYELLLTPEVAIDVEDGTAFTEGQTISVNGQECQVVSVTGNQILVNFIFTPNLSVYITYDSLTLAFDETKNRWTTDYDFKPEGYGTVDDKTLMFRNGELWVGNSNPIRNNFFGVQYSSYVDFVFNVSPFMIKLWWAMRTQSNSKWYCPSITLSANASYPTGMSSRLKPDSFKLTEGQYYSDFLYDMNDPAFTNTLEALLRGRNLRGETMRVRLQNDSTDLATLRMAEVFTSPSMLTEP